MKFAVVLVVLALGVPSVAGAQVLEGPRLDGHWRGGVLFDEGFRSALRLTSIREQEVARTVSDVMLLATLLDAAVVDGLSIPLARGETDLAWQSSFAHVLALGVTIGLGEVVKHAVGRARPFERECAQDPDRPGCQGDDVFESFYSLHSGVAFTSAGFSCSMHLSRSLYQDVAADAASCAASLVLAMTTGLLRVVADRHYLTDVLIGAALGFLVGYLMPLGIVPERAPNLPVTGNASSIPTVGTGISGTF